MASIPIKRGIERIPGGMMIVPLFTSAVIATIFPDVAKFFGSFTGALFTGASTAGNAAAVPAIVAAANPVYKPAAATATVLVATSVVVTAILVPILTAWWVRHVARRSVPPPGAALEGAAPSSSTR